MRRIVGLLLLIAIAVGGVLAWRTGRERARLGSIHDRLTREIGDLPIGDTAKILLRAVETGEPLHYAWHFHLPPNSRLTMQHSWGGSSSSSSSEPRDFLFRVRFHEDSQGRLEVHTLSEGSSGRLSRGDRSLADLLRGRWAEILVERAGVVATSVIEPGKPTVLLRLMLPDDLREAARNKLPRDFAASDPPIFFEMIFNPDPPKP